MFMPTDMPLFLQSLLLFVIGFVCCIGSLFLCINFVVSLLIRYSEVKLIGLRPAVKHVCLLPDYFIKPKQFLAA